MRYYETLYIINPNYEQERLDKIRSEVAEAIGGDNITIINHRIWGKKRLAYPIQKHKYGTYILLQFETESIDGLTDFDTWMKLNRGVIRHQTVKLDVRPEVIEEEEVLDSDGDGQKTEKESVDEEKASSEELPEESVEEAEDVAEEDASKDDSPEALEEESTEPETAEPVEDEEKE